MPRGYIDLTGQTINGVQVIGIVDEKGGSGKHRRWYCICPVCNKTYIVASQHLRDKRKPVKMCFDCSLKQYNDLSGRQFGKLKVISRDLESKSKRIKYICECECGSIVSVQENHLSEGTIKSCGCTISSGEESISAILTSKGIEFERQKTFAGCKYKRLLKFDFYIPKINAVIEYQGMQHYEPIEFFGGLDGLKELQKRDQIKRDYCNTNHIAHFEISYKEDIETALLRILSNEDMV